MSLLHAFWANVVNIIRQIFQNAGKTLSKNYVEKQARIWIPINWRSPGPGPLKHVALSSASGAQYYFLSPWAESRSQNQELRIKIGLPSNGRNTRLNIINQIMPLIHWTFKVAENQMSLQKMMNIFKDPQSIDKTYSKIIRLYKHWTMEIYLHDIWKKSNAG